MCHGPLDSVFRVVEETLAENRGRRSDRAYEYRSPSVGPSIDAELARMYARGQINRDTFLRLRPMSRRGELTWADLDELRREARLQPPPGSASADDNAALTSIREKRAALEQAARESESVARSLDQRIVALTEEASRLEGEAREALPTDEERARALLVKRQEILERSGALKERVSALRQDIQRLEDLGVELDVREQELKVLQARERLGALEEEIRGGHRGSQKGWDV